MTYRPSVHKSEIVKKSDREKALLEIKTHAPKEVSSAVSPDELHTEGLHSYQKYHRLAEVRIRQMLPLPFVAEHLGISVSEALQQENPETDLPLSQLYRWRSILDTSVGELIVEYDDVPSNPIKNRCQLVNVMKTARSILEGKVEKRTEILTNQLIGELTELMPELSEITAWPSVGQSHEPKSPGQAVLRHFDDLVARRLEME